MSVFGTAMDAVPMDGYTSGIYLEKSPKGGKSTSEDILGGGGHAYSGQYSILKGCNSQGGGGEGAEFSRGGANAPAPP